jgi:outer membrane receptor protein involved in Fe transport
VYYLFNFSLYESLFGLQQKEEQNSSYNGNYVVHGLFGKEFNLSRNATLGINLKGTVGGGRRFTPIDLEESLARGYQVNDWSRPYEARLPQYFRLDLQLNYRHNLEKFISELRVDVQNLSDRENIGYYYYDPARQEIRKKLQVGLLPVITWRVEF